MFAICFSALSCSDNDELNPSQSQGISGIGEPASVEIFPVTYNSATGTNNVTNFYDYEFEWVEELPDPSTFESENARQKYVALGGQILSSREIFIPVTSVQEQYATVPSGYVVTGVGALISSSNNNYASIVLEYRYIYSNGSMSGRYRTYSGLPLQPSQLEAWYAVPEGAAVWGIGVKGKYDVQSLNIHYKFLNKSTVRLGNTYYTGISGTNPTGQNDVLYFPFEHNLDNQRAVIQGLGLLANSDGTVRMKIDAGTLK